MRSENTDRNVSFKKIRIRKKGAFAHAGCMITFAVVNISYITVIGFEFSESLIVK